jgi:hypothetical protein
LLKRTRHHIDLNTMKMLMLIKRAFVACALMSLAIAFNACADHEYQAYQGVQQNWPTAPGAFVEMKAGVPIYYRYPPRPTLSLEQLQENRGS